MLDASADGFRVDLGGFGVVDSAVLGPGAVSVANDTAFGLEWVAQHYRVDAVYTLAPVRLCPSPATHARTHP